MDFREDENPRLVAIGMMVLGMLTDTDDPQVQGAAIAKMLTGAHDESLIAAFEHVEDSDAALQTLVELKDSYRKALQTAIDEAWKDKDTQGKVSAEEAVDKFMGNNEPHILGTVTELAEKYGISKSNIRRLKREGQLEAFIDDWKE